MSEVDPTLIPAPPQLSDVEVEAALRGESENPVFGVAERHMGVMRTHNPESMEGRDALVADLITTAPYELDVLTLIAIWAVGVEDPAKSGMSRSFSVPLVAVHALYDPTNPESAGVAKDYINTASIGGAVMHGASYVEGARSRLRHVFHGLKQLTEYVHGVPDVMTVVSQLDRSDDPVDQTRLDELLQRGEERDNPVFGSVLENITNASLRLSMELEQP